MSAANHAGNGKITVPDILSRKASLSSPENQPHKKITCLTAYDYPTARLLDEAGVDILLVGDSLGMVVLGYESTLPVTMEEMLHHTRAVRRGAKHALVVADMPYGSFHASAEETLRNAIRCVKEAGAEAVKVEGGERRLEIITRLVEAEVPVSELDRGLVDYFAGLSGVAIAAFDRYLLGEPEEPADGEQHDQLAVAAHLCRGQFFCVARNQLAQLVQQQAALTRARRDLDDPAPAALDHARQYEALLDRQCFPRMRKHLGWYCKGFPSAAAMRAAMVRASSSEDVARLVSEYQAGQQARHQTDSAHRTTPALETA